MKRIERNHKIKIITLVYHNISLLTYQFTVPVFLDQSDVILLCLGKMYRFEVFVFLQANFCKHFET